MKKAKTPQAGQRPSRKGARLFKSRKRLSERSRLPAGAFTHVGDSGPAPARATLITYSEDSFQEETGLTAARIRDLPELEERLWIHVEGLQDLDLIRAIGDRFGLSTLTLEDIANTSQRSKIDESSDHIYLVMKMLRFDEEAERVGYEQLSVVLGKGFVLTFREIQGPEFDQLKQRLSAGKGRIRRSGSDFLAYGVLDTVVDDYFVVLDLLADRIELLEDEVASDPTTDTLKLIHILKTDMSFVRRSVWPLREMINRLMNDSIVVAPATLPYLRDVGDHTIHAIDTLETYRDVLSGMLDIYLSGVSNRLNQIMKVLTVIATIFIPLTFMTGWYGMNFKHMPELEWRWGYPAFMLAAFSVASGMLLYFWRKDWL